MDRRLVMLCCAPNGARRGTADHAAIPVTPKQMAHTARRCLDAGISILHCHARDADGKHSLDPELNSSYLDAVRRAVGDELIVQLTTEAAGIYTRDVQSALLRAVHPESFSIAMRELCPDEASQDDYAALLAETQADGVRVQHIVYSAEELERFIGLHDSGVVAESRPFMLFVLGKYSGTQAGAGDLLPFLQALQGRDWPWMVCAFGPQESACALTAAALGGHARIGFENNLQAPDGRGYADNAESVATVRKLIEALDGNVADVHVARQLLSPG
ncbi:MAG: 3-keto-5-aminohexanoate cleavage protein [Acidihalobacter sp.]|uniref:3-keto-5-aminohexanoate cleavage protein n=1 Tax=Acidihalobacter sp. TaxID=1872108 RepID=UPI00307EBA36